MKRIAVFTISMGAGGAERVISLLLPELIKNYDVHLILMYNSVYYPIPKDVHVDFVYPDAQNTLWRKLTSIVRTRRFLKDYLSIHDIKCVLSFLTRPNIVSGMLKQTFPNTRFILSERNYTHHMYANRSSLESKFIEHLIRRYYNRADALFGNSDYIIDGLRKDYDVRIPMSVIYNPIQIPSDHIESDRCMSDEWCVKDIVTVGSFKQEKNHQLLFEAISRLPNHHLTIYGDGILRPSYEERIGLLGLADRVSLPGQTRDTQSTLLDYDLFVLSSDTEGFPNALLEALSVGLPAISTNCVSGPLEMLNENEVINVPIGGFAKAKYGILINPRDEKGLTAAILYLSSDPTLYSHYSKVGRERARHYALSHIYKKIQSLIEDPNEK